MHLVFLQVELGEDRLMLVLVVQLQGVQVRELPRVEEEGFVLITQDQTLETLEVTRQVLIALEVLVVLIDKHVLIDFGCDALAECLEEALPVLLETEYIGCPPALYLHVHSEGLRRLMYP